MVYTEMLIEDRIALHSGNCTIKTKLIVSPGTSEQIILTEQDAIKSWEHTEERYVPDVGFVGQFIARELTGELHNISEDFNIENKIVELRFAVVRNDEAKTETWYSLGKFVVMQPEDDEVNDNTTFEAFDLTTLFNIEFDANYTDDTFKKSFADTIAEGNSFTALMLAKYTCNQVGIDLETSFTNNMFEITSNQFTEGDSCRDVLKAIAQLAFGWCRIGWDNKLYIETISTDVSNISETEILTNNQYYSLTTQKEYFGPVNRVYIGPSMIEGEGVVTDDNESTEANGDIVINVYDNPITYTHELRKLALKNADKLFGLKYIPFETETVGHPWYKASKPIIVVDMEGNEKQTYPFSVVTKYTGHIKTTISAVELTQAQKENGYDKSIYKDITKVKIEVDKSKQEIRAVAESVEYKTTPTAKMSGSKITFNDGTVAPLIDFQIEGKSVQETRSGKNLLNASIDEVVVNGLTLDADLEKLYLNGTPTVENKYIFGSTTFAPGTYTLSLELVSGSMSDIIVYVYKGSSWNHLGGITLNSDNNFKNSVTFTISEDTVVNLGPYLGPNKTFNNAVIKYQIVSGPIADYDFEAYGLSPSPDYPSEIKSVGTYNNKTNKYEIEIAITGRNLIDLTPLTQDKMYSCVNYSKWEFIHDNTLNQTVFHGVKTQAQGVVYPQARFNLPTERFNPTGKNLAVVYRYRTVGNLQQNIDDGCWIGFTGRNVWEITGINSPQYAKDVFIKPSTEWAIGSMRISKDNPEYTAHDLSYRGISICMCSKAKDVEIFVSDIMVVEISDGQYEAAEYVPPSFETYNLKTTLVELDQPLRSLPDGTKDIVYIQNGKVYLERHIIDLTLNGTENMLVGQYGTNAYKITPSLMPNNNRSNYEIMSNGFLGVSHADRANYTSNFVYVDGRDLYFRNTDFATLDEFKTYLAENNVEVQYKLATTLVKTEELGKIEMPSTFKGVTNITTTDTLEPIIHLEYVRDSNISSYVEGQIKTERVLREENVAQLIIEDNQIRESVSSVSADLTSANTTINKVEETLTSHEKTITVISTNIDIKTGAVKEVTTTNGFTFNDGGLNIYTDQNSYNTQINNVGTYYKDGDEIVSQTTKDGSLLKNLSQQGQSQYSYDNINNEYEFVEERINVDGEYVYATFYNGEE